MITVGRKNSTKHYAIPIVIVLLLVSSSFVGISYRVDKTEKPPETTMGDGGLMDSAWPMKCQNLRHSSQSPYSTEENPHTEKWRFRTEDIDGTIESSLVVDSDGIVYFGSMGSDHQLYSIYPNGTKKWSYETNGLIWSTPALAEDGTIYVGSWDHKLYALYPNGTRRWKFNVGDAISSSPAIGNDGTIYFGCNNKKIFAVNPNGTEKWQYRTDDIVFSNPAIGDDGTIYAGSCDSGMYAIYPNGTLNWRFDTGGEIKGHPSISQDGVIYFNSWDNYLYAVYPNGTMKWRTNVGAGTSGSAAIAEDGTIYFFTDTLNAYYPNNGTLKWSLDIGGNGGNIAPAISADGTIYVGNHEGKSIVAVNPDGTEKWRKKICSIRVASSPIIAEDGTIYVGSSHREMGEMYSTGYVHAFGAGRNLTADAGGPYSGNAEESIQFEGTVFGGVLPYNYNWDFGDGNTSDIEDPKHTYARPGEYIASFAVVDGDGNMSSDTANVAVGTSRPKVKITKPENALYFANIRLFSFPIPLIIGRIKVKVDAYQEDVGIDRVVFTVDYQIKFTDYEEPYEWIWSDREFFIHTLTVTAHSNDGKSEYDEMEVMKFF